MSIYKGDVLTVEIFGESHSERIGALVSGMPETKIDFALLSEFTARRKGGGDFFATGRAEKDEPIFSGVKDNAVRGEYSFYIVNGDVKSSDYSNLYGKPRPSHADYAWYQKDGVLNFAGGGRFSGRMTAPLCVVGGICKQYLESKGVQIAAYVSQIGNCRGKTYKEGKSLSYAGVLKERKGFPSLSDKRLFIDEIEKARQSGDSVGGIIECIVFGLKGGVGNNLFGGIEGKISSLLYSIPAVKGVEFGQGFAFGKMFGSEANDELFYDDNAVRFASNNSGGINGGISNGEPITMSVAIRPTPSIQKEQNTVDLVEKKNVKIKITGRHDACIVPRAVPCVESAVAIALTDMIGGKNE